MKKHFRLFSIFLVIILSFSFLSVNSLAAGEENLIDSDLRNWTDANTISPFFKDIDVVASTGFPGFYALNIPSPFDVAFLYDVSNSVYIDNTYHFSFDLKVQNYGVLFDVYNLEVYVAGIAGNDISVDNVSPNVHYTIDKSNYQYYIDNGFSFDFKLDSVIGDAAIVFAFTPIGEVPSGFGSLALCYIGNVSLTRVESNTEGKLDGILGWLQELYDSIVNGFSNLGDSLTNVWQRITTKLGDVSTNITGSITDSWQRITTKLGDISTNITGSITALGDKLINYLLYFDDEVPDNPFEGVDSPLEHIQDFFDDLIDYLSSIGDDIETVIDSITGPVTLLDHFTKRFEWLFGIVIFTLMLIVVSRFIGL